MRKQIKHAIQTLLQVNCLEQRLLLRRLDVYEAGDEVGKRAGRGNRLDGGDELLRSLRQELEDLKRALLQLHESRLDLAAGGLGLFDAPDARRHEWVALEILDHAEALLPLANDVMRAVGRRDVAHDVGNRANEAKLVRPRPFGLRVPLQQDPDRPLCLRSGLGGGDRAFAAERERKDHSGEEHHLAHGQDDERVLREGIHPAGRRPGRGGARLLACRILVPAVEFQVHVVYSSLRKSSVKQPFSSLRSTSWYWPAGSTIRRSKRP